MVGAGVPGATVGRAARAESAGVIPANPAPAASREGQPRALASWPGGTAVQGST